MRAPRRHGRHAHRLAGNADRYFPSFMADLVWIAVAAVALAALANAPWLPIYDVIDAVTEPYMVRERPRIVLCTSLCTITHIEGRAVSLQADGALLPARL